MLWVGGWVSWGHSETLFPMAFLRLVVLWLHLSFSEIFSYIHSCWRYTLWSYSVNCILMLWLDNSYIWHNEPAGCSTFLSQVSECHEEHINYITSVCKEIKIGRIPQPADQVAQWRTYKQCSMNPSSFDFIVCSRYWGGVSWCAVGAGDKSGELLSFSAAQSIMGVWLSLLPHTRAD